MNKKIIIFIVLMMLILLTPGIVLLKDGGSVEYKAILYKITRIKRFDENAVIEKGWDVKILGMNIYNSVKKDMHVLKAKIVNISDNSMLIKVIKAQDIFAKDQEVIVNISGLSAEKKKNLTKDLEVKIYFNGNVLNSLPAKIIATRIEKKEKMI